MLDQQLPTTVSKKAVEAMHRLAEVYGWKQRGTSREPMKQLISTMLSHRTTWKQESTAYQQMWQHYGSWDAVQHAPTNELTRLLAPVQYPEVKAPNIQKVLARIYDERGEYNIDFLAEMPTDEALAWLLSLPGVGLKTATLLLLFNFGKLVLPVDTHVHRVSTRLGLISAKTTAEKAHHVLLAMLPQDAETLYNFHVLLFRHGQNVCIWREPRCHLCPLRNICDDYQARKSSAA